MKRALLCFVCFLALSLTACASRQGAKDDYSLSILHTNDVHAVYGGLNAEGRPCYAALCTGGQGGSVRLEQALRLIREQNRAQNRGSLLLDAGDESQGTLFYTRHKENAPAMILPYLGYTALTPGNHEFDEGCDLLRSLAREMDTPIVAANLSLPSIAGETAPPVRPWIVVEKEGRRIGIVGLITPATKSAASPCPESSFSEPAPALRQAVAELQAQGVNIIIALTHMGLSEDRDLAKAVDGVDVIVGGHSHSLLSNTDPKALGPYPLVEQSPTGQPVLIVTAAYGGRLLGRLNVNFDAQGRPTSWEGEPIRLNEAGLAELAAASGTQVAPDPELVRRMEALAEPLIALTRQPVGRLELAGVAAGELVDKPDALVCRVRECVSGNLITDAMLDGVRGEGVQAALLNGGGIRNPLPAGPVAVGDLLTSMPFENLLVVGEVPGKTLLEMLEHGLARREDVKGQFLQTAGIRYAFDPARPAGKRLLSAEIRDARGKYRPITPAGRYRIVTTDYMVEGGDGFSMLSAQNGQPALAWHNTGLGLTDVLRAAFEKKNPLKAGLEGRITVKE